MAKQCASNFVDKLQRRKFIDVTRITDTNLRRCLTTLDLTALGIGSTLGAGIYVVAGQVAKETAGPSVILSFLVAALASVLAGLCYAEFGARVPKTGSAYVYSYVTVGELWAFIIGWNLVLEYVIGTASVARAWSANFDSLIDNKISSYLSQYHMGVSWLSEYPDIFAFALTLLLTCVLAIGVKESSRFNNIFTGVNLLVVSYVIITGIFKADPHNWALEEDEIPSPSKNGEGGFMPFGFSGMMSGAATCFYAFVGFDIIATTGEECNNPQKAIPISIVVALFACFLAYFGVSTILTLMCPYYLLDASAPLPQVFDRVGWPIARYIISVGAVCGLSTSLLGAMFPLPRVIYAMASDGLLFRFLARVNERFKTPLIATIISGVFAGLMAMIFDLKELVDMMSIGTLLAYTLVAACVLILRYQADPFAPSAYHLENGSIALKEFQMDDILSGDDLGPPPPPPDTNSKPDGGLESRDGSGWRHVRAGLFRPGHQPTALSGSIVSYSTMIISIFIIAFCAVLIFADDEIMHQEPWALALAAVLGLCILVLIFIIARQPQNLSYVTFKVPGLPFLPLISIFVNLYLMLKLSVETWMRFGVWMLVGFLIYFGYGVWNSSESERYEQHMRRLATEATLPRGDSLLPAASGGGAGEKDLPLHEVDSRTPLAYIDEDEEINTSGRAGGGKLHRVREHEEEEEEERKPVSFH